MRARLNKWMDEKFHRYATNALLLAGLIYYLAASVNWLDIYKH